MDRILPLDNPIMNYAWGSKIHIPSLLGHPTPSEEPQAELWMGAHPKAPSRVNGRSLIDIIAENPKGMLGAATATRYSNRLPFLFKLLAADTPLSIQAHPNRAQATAGFAAENTAGIPLDAPNRNYKDDSHKPEVLCALTDFWGLNGFRRIPALLALMDEMKLEAITSEVERLRQTPDRKSLRQFFRAVIALEDTRKNSLLRELKTNAQRLKGTTPEYDWILRISDLYPGDIGVFCVVLLNLVSLKPGQAMYCAAGDLHAYLDGFGVELMANSDNVLRGGLTPKHVDLEELMKILTFQDREVEILEPICGQYHTPAEEFCLSVQQVDGLSVFAEKTDFEIFINVDGGAKISHPETDQEISLPQGSSVAVPSAVTDYVIEGEARLFRATVGPRP